ncbi:B-cell linker protein isoform X2 [Periophthalmus magnuspinnatus]|uniref:B-cell linker protein isoform X2 n=1 Tax=Periophthalmus magnuspinnatus TaxID=409849 RepID=UPI002436D449|nr:B-cell linker protein isoform X2 [Periophthalmus magnuspinnatus]
MQILAHKFNMDTLNRLTSPATAKFRQLQKIVQDIKKNDGSILDKLRRLKSKSVPRLPARDYRGEDRDESEGSDPEYDNETYEAPQGDHDDSYEPPPSHQHRVFTSGAVPRGEYLDSCRGRPERPPNKPQRLGRAGKRLPPPPISKHQDNDEEDYINPDGNNDDDNYIEPDENPPHRGRAVRNLPRVSPQRPSSPDCYEVPDTEVKPQPPPVVNSFTAERIQKRDRLQCPKPSQPHPLPPTPSPRLPPRSTTPEPTGDDEYEVCDADDIPECSSDKLREPRPLPHPKPLPRERSPKPLMKPKLPVKPSFREFENRTLPLTPSEPAPLPSKAFSLDLKRPKIPIPHFLSHRQTDQHDVPDKGCVEENKAEIKSEEELHSKPWFAQFCDRKTADEALLECYQDGAFLVRKSSGHDAQQPYTLVVLYNNRVYNIPIRFIQSSQQFALGREKRGEEYFSSLTHIIEHHERTPLVLIDSQSNSKDATRLTFPVKP